LFDPPIRNREFLRQYPRLADHADEAGVRYPAWQHVHVDMAGDARAGGLAQIHSQIETFRFVEFAENSLQLAHQLHHLGGGVRGEFLQLVDMLKGYYHHVAGSVRVGVQNDITVVGPMDNERFFVVFFAGKVAKQASWGRVSAGYESITPGRKKKIHGLERYQKK